jgi:hypothetical protein
LVVAKVWVQVVVVVVVVGVGVDWVGAVAAVIPTQCSASFASWSSTTTVMGAQNFAKGFGGPCGGLG